MKITSELFEKSFFYIGAGFDTEPMERFTHITDTFLYANLFIEKEKITKWYDEKFQHGDFRIIEKTIADDFDELDYFEMSKDFTRHLMRPDFISAEELRSYSDTFQTAQGLSQFAVFYKVLRKSLNREFTVIIFSGEGIASYIALSQNGKFAPKILATIETGVVEHPESLLNNFFKNILKKRPLLWIRGFEPRYYPHYTRNAALDEKGVFSVKALDFNLKYYCGWSYFPRQRSMKRYCKGFVTSETFNSLVSMKLKKDYIDINHQFCFKGIEENRENIKPNDIVLLSRKISQEIQFEGITVLVLEDLIGYRNYLYNWEGSPVIDYLFNSLDLMPVPTGSTIHIIPFFKEDGGEVYFQTVKKFPFKTITYVKNPFDFIDFKESMN